MITNADMNTATQETYKAINSQITQNNGTWSLTQTSQGLSFSGKNFNYNADFAKKLQIEILSENCLVFNENSLF